MRLAELIPELRHRQVLRHQLVLGIGQRELRLSSRLLELGTRRLRREQLALGALLVGGRGCRRGARLAHVGGECAARRVRLGASACGVCRRRRGLQASRCSIVEAPPWAERCPRL